MAKTKTIRITTPTGKAIWPKLLEPDFQYNDKGVYSTGIRLSDEEAAPIVEALQTLYDDEFEKTVGDENLRKAKKMGEKITRAKLPWGPAQDRVQDADGDWIPQDVPGFTDIKVKLYAKRTWKDKSGVERSATQAPTVVDKFGDAVQDTIGGGSRIQVGFRARPYYINQEVGYGVSLTMDIVVVHERMERDDLGAYGIVFEDKPEGLEEEVSVDEGSVDFE